MIRTKEIVHVDKNSVVSREEMAAHHLLVTLPAGEDPDIFLKRFGSHATSMMRMTQDAPLHLLYLASSSLEALPQARARAHDDAISNEVASRNYRPSPCCHG